jgi:hypothetical protein
MESRMDARLGAMESRMDARLGAMDARLDAMDARLDARLTPVVRHILALEQRMESGFTMLQDQIVDSRRDMLTHFDEVYSRLDRLSVDFDVTKGGLRGLEERVTALEKRSS